MPTDVRYRALGEVANTIAMLDWLTVITLYGKKKTHVENYQGKLPAFINQLRTIGEAGTVYIRNNGKVKDRGATMLFIGEGSQYH